MRIVLYTSVLSPHMLPFFRELAGTDGVTAVNYVYSVPLRSERASLGWSHETVEGGIKCFDDTDRKVVYDVLRQADVLLLGVLDDWIMSVIRKTSVRVYYLSERWVKPPIGILRFLLPSFWKRIFFVRDLFARKNFCYLAIGPYAAEDMLRLLKILSGDVRCVFKSPVLKISERNPLASFIPTIVERGDDCRLEKIKLWGYFVEPAKNSLLIEKCEKSSIVNVLWVGRMIKCKRVDSLIAAVVKLLQMGYSLRLQIVGHGPEENNLRMLAGDWLQAGRRDTDLDGRGIFFCPSMPIEEIRGLMSRADIYVFPSDGYEGWGSVVNEAMAEQCCVVGTKEAGSSATLISDNVTGLLVRSGDALEIQQCLLQLMNAEIRERMAVAGSNFIRRNWSPSLAAARLLEHIRNH